MADPGEVVLEEAPGAGEVIVESGAAAATAPPAESVTTRDAAAPAGPSTAPADGIEELRRQMDREREEAARRVTEAEFESRRVTAHAAASELAARAETIKAHYQAATANVGQADAMLTKLQEDQAQLLADGRFEEASKLQTQMAEAVVRKRESEGHKGALESQWAELQQAAQRLPRAETAPPTFEQQKRALIANMPPNSQRWVEEHPQFVTDPRFREAVMGAHAIAVQRHGESVIDKPEYFQTIEELVGVRQRQQEQVAMASPPTQPLRPGQQIQSQQGMESGQPAVTISQPTAPRPIPAASTAASPSSVQMRSIGGVRTDGQGRFVMSADQVAAADAIGMDRAVYAKRLVEAAQDPYWQYKLHKWTGGRA